jgi:hypothetical protein
MAKGLPTNMKREEGGCHECTFAQLGPSSGSVAAPQEVFGDPKFKTCCLCSWWCLFPRGILTVES